MSSRLTYVGWCVLLAATGLIVTLGAARAETERTIVGQIMDSTCLAKGEKPDADHADCARKCIQGGAPIAIVADRTNQVYIALAPEGESIKEKLLPYVGRRCKLVGDVVAKGGSQFLVVRAVVPEHEHDAQEDGVVAMIGDLHLEAVALKSGDVRVFLSDAFRKPLSVAGRTGRVEAPGTAQARPRSAPLEPGPGGKYLIANLGPLTETQAELTIRLPVEKDPDYFITFMLEPTAAPVKASPPGYASAEMRTANARASCSLPPLG